ncbi:MAG: DUF4331 family protein [Stagnimonas sp.]|nr:DUF4331 family protein [Stagnimonas sp.]
MQRSFFKPASGRTWAAAAVLLLTALSVSAADHADAPRSTTDPASDITDVFIFREGGKLVGAICFGGTPAPNLRVDGPTGRFDPDVLFTYNIDLDGDARPEHEIIIRFGLNSKGESGVQFEGIPGAGAQLVSGPVERVLASPTGLKAYAGLRDDPFFFDFEGFTATIGSFNSTDKPKGSLFFNASRDSFARRNLTALVFEMDPSLLVPRAGNSNNQLIRVWASGDRLIK